MSGKRAKQQRRRSGGGTSGGGARGGNTGRGRGLSRGWTWALVLVAVAAFGVFVFEPVWRPLVSQAPELLAPGELTALGATVYRENCAVCHGADAQGQEPGQRMGGQRPDGTYIAPALNGTAHAWHHPPDALFQLIKQGSPAPDSPMRGFAQKLSDREIHAVLAYLQSLWPETVRERYRTMHARS